MVEVTVAVTVFALFILVAVYLRYLDGGGSGGGVA